MVDERQPGTIRGVIIDMNAHRKRANRPLKKTKDAHLMIRVDDDLKEVIRGLADKEGLSMSSFARFIFTRLANGWKLVPPSD